MSERTADPTQEPSPVESEAAAWFARLNRPAVATDTLRDFRAWRANPEHAEAYAKVEAVWDQAGRLRHDPDLRAQADALLARPRPGTTMRRILPLGLLAAAGVAGAIGWSAYMRAPSYETRVGEQRLVQLDDGSRVRLNTDTRVVIRYRASERGVDLVRGEALFEAAHDAARPFVVRAGETQVRALGTRFDVRRDEGALQVTLLEGRVRVGRDHHPAATLDPNQAITVTDGRLDRPVTVDAAAAASWTTGRLTFQALPLEQAIAEVNRYSTRKVRLDGTVDVASRPVSGVFDAGDTDAFASAVATLFELEASKAPNGDVRLHAPS